MDDLVCGSCGARLSVESFDRRAVVVRCSYCGGESARPDGQEGRPPIPKPGGVRECREGSRLTIQLGSRYDERSILVLAFAALGTLVLWNAVFGGPAATGSHAWGPWIAFALTAAVFAVALVPVLLAVGGVLNRTRVELTDAILRVGHHPVPLPKAREIAVSSIEQLFVSSIAESQKGGTRRVFHTLNMIDDERRSRRLSVAGIRLEEALYLEQEIELFIGLQDRAVALEVRT